MLNKLLRIRRRTDIGVDTPVRATVSPAATSRQEMPPESAVESAIGMASAGFYAEALARIDASLEKEPANPDWIFARGWTLFEWARFTEARAWLQKAVASGRIDPLIFLRLGWSCIWTTGAQSGEAWMRRAADLAPDDWLGHFGLGASLHGQGRFDDAIVCFERALDLSPDNAHCLAHLFDCRYAQTRFAEAEAFARRAMQADAGNPRAWSNLGIALIAQDRFDEATEAFERGESAAAGTGEVDPHLNLGICLRETRRLPEALELYERNLPRRPSVAAHAHYGHALLTAGRLEEGWVHYEFRWLQDPLLSLRPPFRKPLWLGQDLHGKTILLRSEQGIGDVIQFIRYAPHVKALGATVLLELRKNIRELAVGFPGVDRILEPREPYPEFDYYVHLMSLPRVFGTGLGSIPAEVPYLHAEPSRIDHWADRVRADGRLKVGLVWAGDPAHLRDRYRSIPLQSLAPLGSLEGVRYFSLQKGSQAAQLEEGCTNVSIVDLGPDLRDFADTAAVISQLELLICADTSVAHLAGALGKPVWVLVPTPSDWRWLEGRADNPWYPTMRLFRQQRAGDWSEVVARLTHALKEQLGRREVGAAERAPSTSTSGGRPVANPSDEPSSWLRPGHTAVSETRVGILQYWPDEAPIGTSIERYGEYLQRQLDVLARWIAPGSTIVEAGAGIGHDAVFLASAIGPFGHLFLYEDDALCKQVLRQNLAANRIGNCTMMKRRLGRGVDRASGGGAKATAAEEVPSIETIDELRLENLHWIKVNERADAMAVLEGAADTLWRLRPNLLVAAPDHESLLLCAARTKDFGYQCFRMETPLYNPDNFNRRVGDVFQGRIALAMLAIPEETQIDIPIDHCVEI